MEVIIYMIQQWGALVVAVCSLLIAIISLVNSSKAQKLQNKVNELELRIKQNEIEKIRLEKEKAISSCVEARVIRISNGKYKLKVWNSGATKVCNINIDADDENIFMKDDIIPFEELEPNKSFEIWMLVYTGSPRKFYVTTIWTDGNGVEQRKKQLVSL